MARRFLKVSIITALFAVAVYLLLNKSYFPDPTLTYKPSNEQWGKSDSSKTAVLPFTVNVSEVILTDLKRRLSQWREPVSTFHGVDFKYGLPSQKLSEVVKYWRDEYDWRKEETRLNTLPQFQTVINGLNVHFIHIKGDSTALKRIPLLIVHGWPGSVVEFYKAIPLLTAKRDEMAFDIVAPSIPGYGFSEAPAKPGFSPIAIAEIFGTLMSRLGYEKYVYQGGDWGAIIGSVVAHMYPQKVIGYHTNFATPPGATPMDNLHLIAAFLAPSLVIGKEEGWKISLDKINWFIEESGYFHEQATKPDTIGIGLADSPAALAGYILEKFASWSQDVEFKTGHGLTNEEILTNIMLYWVTNHGTSSVRLYKEYVKSDSMAWAARSFHEVPTAIACYPAEALCIPTSLARRQMPRLVHSRDMPKGGHFAAFEQPELFVDDLRSATAAFLKTRTYEDKWGTGLGLGV